MYGYRGSHVRPAFGNTSRRTSMFATFPPVSVATVSVQGRIAVVAIIEPEHAARARRLLSRLSPSALSSVRLVEESGVAADVTPHLTARQHAILDLLLQELSNKEIGRRLQISHFTVRNHVSRLLEILGVPSRKAAIARFGGAPFRCDHRGSGRGPVARAGDAPGSADRPPQGLQHRYLSAAITGTEYVIDGGAVPTT